MIIKMISSLDISTILFLRSLSVSLSHACSLDLCIMYVLWVLEGLEFKVFGKETRTKSLAFLQCDNLSQVCSTIFLLGAEPRTNPLSDSHPRMIAQTGLMASPLSAASCGQTSVRAANDINPCGHSRTKESRLPRGIEYKSQMLPRLVQLQQNQYSLFAFKTFASPVSKGHRISRTICFHIPHLFSLPDPCSLTSSLPR